MLQHTFFFRWVAVLLCFGGLFTACKKSSPTAIAKPTISYVAQPLDSAGIDSGSFTQWVIIYGTNLGTTSGVTFNDQSVSFNALYASDTSVTVQIPRAIPQNVSNTITVTTKGGTASYTFTVLIPDLSVGDMLNEWTAEGDTLTVLGQNFDLYDLDTSATTVTFTGGATANVVASSSTQLQVIVPSGVQSGPITIKGPAPLNISRTTVAWYRDNRNFLFDMSSFNGWNGTSYLSSGPDPAPINGPYFEVAKSWQANWNWDPFCSNNCAMPAELVNDPSQYVNYALKFEMNIAAGPVSMPFPLYMCFNSGNFKEFFFDVSGNNTYPFTTNGKWQTFTAPLSAWGNLQGFSFSNPIIMEFMLKNSTAGQSNFAICNFRMVRIN